MWNASLLPDYYVYYLGRKYRHPSVQGWKSIALFLKSINGSLLIIFISSMIHFKLLADLGEKTKEIMILHYKPFYWTSWARQLFDKLFSPNIFGLVMITIVTIAGCIILDTILKRIKIWRTIMGK